MSSERLAGRVAVVTGGAAGIGRATALRLATEGARLFVVDIDGAGTKRTVADIEAHGGEAGAVVVDLADAASRATAIPAALDRFGRVDILVNNAAYLGRRSPFLDMPDDDWDKVLATNVTAAMALARDAARDMLQRGTGAIINITALQERLPLLTYAAYGASKGALLSLTRYLAAELSPRGIRVNAVQPAVIASDASDTGEPSSPEPAATLLGRSGTPGEIAAAVAFLASDEASFITGVELPVDGGRGVSRLRDPLAAHHDRADRPEGP